MNKKIEKNIKGITMVALVVTIIVLLILSAVTVSLVVGNKGIFIKGEQSAKEYNKQEASEAMNLKISGIQIESYGETQTLPTLQYLADKLCEDEEMEYVVLKSKKEASLEKIDTTNAKSIYTKIKKYPYEFEINSSLQLASIDGVKIATEETVTIPKKEYEELKSKVESIGKIYEKTNTVSLNTTNVWTDLKDVTWTIPKGNWIVDIGVSAINGNNGLFTFVLKNEDESFSYMDGDWKSDRKCRRTTL